jgi:hypothetical protein
VTKFTKTIKEIHDNNEFFDIDYNDLLNNFDTNDIEEKEKTSMQLSVVNIAFLDAVRGDVSRPKFIDRILTIFRKEFIDDIKYRQVVEGEEFKGNESV